MFSKKRYQKIFRAAQPITLEVKFEELIPADVDGYAKV